MKKKDYELIAEAIRGTRYSGDGLDGLAHLLAAKFEATGKKFDRQKFLTACGIETKVLGLNWADGTSTIHTDKGIITVPTDQVQQ